MPENEYQTFEQYVAGQVPSFLPVIVRVENGEVRLEINIMGKKSHFYVYGNNVKQLNAPVIIPGT